MTHPAYRPSSAAVHSASAALKPRGRNLKAACAAALLVSGFFATGGVARAAETISLGAAQNFAILGGSTVTNTGATSVVGNLGLSPGSAVTGFPPGVVLGGTIHINDALAFQAHADAFTAYTQLAGEMLTTNLTGVDLGGLTLAPGVYHFDTSAQLTGTLFLNTGGDPNAAFHFQIGTTLTTASVAAVLLLGLGGASDPNIFWEVGTSATLGSGTVFEGNIVALQSITFNTGANLANGRALAINGAVTLDSNNANGLASLVTTGTFWKGGQSNLWSQVNWSPDLSGATSMNLSSGANVVFSITGLPPQNQNTTLDIDVAISSLTMNDPVPVSISGAHTLTIFGAGATRGITVNAGAGLTTINSKVELSGLSQTVTVNNAAGLVINGVVNGTIGLFKAGSGRLTLSAAETYSGGTIADAGTLQIGDGLTAGSSIAGAVTVNGAGTLAVNLKSGETFANAVTDNGLVTTIASGTNTLSGVLSGTGALTQNGSGLTLLTATNTYSGATSVLQGTLQVGNGILGSILGASAVSVSGGTLAIDLANDGVFANNIANNSLVTTIATGTNTLSGVTSGPGALTQNGQGLTILTGANTYSGATTILQGTLLTGAAHVISVASAVLVNAGSFFDLSSHDQSVGSIADGPAGGGSITLGSATLTTGNDGTDTQFSGIISGPGRVSKVGTGTWTLSGANTYSGRTHVMGGTLLAGAAHVISKRSAVIVDNGARFNLDGFDQSIGSLAGAGKVGLGHGQLVTGNDDTSTLFSGSISGSGTVRKIGAGTWELTGASTFTGLTTVVAGTLAVDGSIAGSTLVAGGILRGVGRIGGHVQNDAVVNPGALKAPGTLSIGGNYTQSSQGTLNIRLGSTLSYDRLAIGGGASLNGALNVSYLNGFNARPGNVFTIATTADGVAGVFSSFNDPHATGTLLTLGVVYERNNVLLEFVQGSFEDAVPQGQCSANERAVGHALDDLAAHRPNDSLIRELDTLQVGQVSAALSLLSPEDLSSIFTGGFALAQVQQGNIERRLGEVRQGANGFSDSGFAVSDPHGARNYDGKSAADGKGSKEVLALAPDNAKRWGFFISGSGELGDIDSTCGARGSSFTTGGVSVGADYRVSSLLVVGAALGYANTSSDLSRGGNLDVDSGKGSLYATVYDRGFYVNGIVGGGYSSYDTKRATLGGFAHGKTDGLDFNALVGTGYDHRMGAFTVGPVASLQYARVGFDGFTEHGAAGALKLDSQSQDSLKSAVGLRAAYTKKLGRIVLTPEVRAQWVHEYLESSADIDAGFASGRDFSVRGPKLGRDGVLVDVGASAQLTSSVAVFAYYSAELGRENYTSHSINGGVQLSF